MLSEAADTDAQGNEKLGDSPGDELPAELADPARAASGFAAARPSSRQSRTKKQTAYEENLAWHTAWKTQHGPQLGGRRTPPDPDELARRRINTTDPDTRLMKRAGGRSVQGWPPALASPAA